MVELAPIAAGVLRLRERTPDPAVPAQGHLRPVHVLPGLPAQGPVHHPGQAAHAGDPAPGARRRLGRLQRAWSASRRSPGCTSWSAPSRGSLLPDVDAAAAGAADRRRGPVLGRRPGRRGDRRRSASSGPGRCSPCSATASRRPTRPTCPPSRPSTTWPRSSSCASPAQDIAFDLWESEGYVGGVPIEHDQRIGAPEPGKRVWRLTIYRTGSPITLTDVLPRLQHMGVDVVDEHPYEFAGSPSRSGSMTSGCAGAAPPDARARAGARASIASVKDLVEGALAALWHGPDRGRRLQRAGPRRAPDLARRWWCCAPTPSTCGRRASPSARTTSSGCCARTSRIDPAAGAAVRVAGSTRPSRPARPSAARPSPRRSAGELDDVASLDQDRILRSYLGPDPGHAADQLLRSAEAGPQPTLPYLVVKLDAARGARPARTAAAVRAVRLLAPVRGRAPAVRRVARGGLRWSDRREDFRTEILGLAKAQEVKNSVIVPSGRQGRLRLQAAARPG